PALDAKIPLILAIAVSPAGEVYFSTNQAGSVVQKIDRDGLIQTVAGVSGQSGFDGDGPLPKLLNSPTALAFGPDGSLYIADKNNGRVRRVKDGVINTVAGGPLCGSPCTY